RRRAVPVGADQKFLLFAHESALAGRPDLLWRWLDSMQRLEADVPIPTDDEAERVEAEAARLVEIWPGNHLAQSSLIRAELRRGRTEDPLRRARAHGARAPVSPTSFRPIPPSRVFSRSETTRTRHAT